MNFPVNCLRDILTADSNFLDSLDISSVHMVQTDELTAVMNTMSTGAGWNIGRILFFLAYLRKHIRSGNDTDQVIQCILLNS